MKEKILEALGQLDPLDDDQWTFEGAPKIETMTSLLGQTVRRQDIVDAAPDFNREKAAKDQAEPPADPDPDKPSPDIVTDGTISADAIKNASNVVDSAEPEVKELPTEADFVAWLRSVPEDQLEVVERDLKSQLDSISREIEEKKALMVRVKKGINITRLHIRAAHPNTSDRDATRQFIDSQTAARAARVNRRNTVLRGIRSEELDPRASIDSSMARKTKRGTQRPAHPLMK